MDVVYIGPQGTPTARLGVEQNRQAALGHLRRILTDTKGHIYKIGIATNPVSRSYAHGKVAVDEREDGDLTYVTFQRGLWDRMFVIFQTTSGAAVREAEREFIEAAQKEFGDFRTHSLVTMNTSTGGEGPLGPRGPYFLYVLRSAG